jgi:S-adenosylmethionine decarboxylase
MLKENRSIGYMAELNCDVVVGEHLLINIINVDQKIINNNETLKDIMETISKKGNFTIIDKRYNNFDPYGFSGIYLLSESHFTFHSWPEYQKLCLDIFTCSKDISYDDIFEYININFGKDNISYLSIKR